MTDAASARPNRVAWLVVAGLFALLWLLPGVRALLLEQWPYLGLGAAAALGFVSVTTRAPGAVGLRDAALLLLIVYLVHQFEEHGVDVLGRRYAFLAVADGFLGPAVGCVPGTACPLTAEAIYWVNTMLVWWPLALAVLWPRPVLVLAGAGLLLSNTVAHVVAAVAERAYNPGLLTALVLFVPASLAVFRFVMRRFDGEPAGLALALAWGALGHALLGLLAVVVYARELLPSAVYPLALFAYGSLPLVVAWARRDVRAIDR